MLSVLLYSACSDNSSSFTEPDITFSEFTDVRDGKVYKCITIDGMTWMAENLAYRIPRGSADGCFTYGEGFIDLNKATVSTDKILQTFTEAMDNGEFPDPMAVMMLNSYLPWLGYYDIADIISLLAPYPDSYARANEIMEQLYENAVPDLAKENFDRAEAKNNGYAERYGFLYTFEATELAIPDGWRIPTDDDWKKLEKALGASQNVLDKLEEWRPIKGSVWLKADSEDQGFDVKHGGARVYGTFMYGSPYINVDTDGYYWSSTQVVHNDSTKWGIIRKFNNVREEVYRGTSNLNAAYNIRCIKK